MSHSQAGQLSANRWFQVVGTFILCAISFGAGWWINERSGSPAERLLETTYRVIASDSIFNKQPVTELSYAGIRGMLSKIDDPYAELIEPKAAQNFTDTFTGKTGVIGLYAENQNGQVVVSIVFPDQPASVAGLHVGDVILAIDGKTLDKSVDSSEAGLMLRGAPGTEVHLTVQRAGQVLEFDLVRAEREYVTSRILPGEIGYLSLNAFNRTASEQMKQTLESLLSQKPTGIIWDLRNNEGGDMQAAQDILSYFIKDGLLFSATLTHDRRVEFRAKGGALASDIPLVVLIDQTSYSAAETSAAAIAETGRGKTIGSRSYGKGVIQATMPLVDNTMLQITIAKWLSPKGEWYQERGVSPQIAASDDPATQSDEVLQKAVEVLLEK